jgi:hypothetical protein
MTVNGGKELYVVARWACAQKTLLTRPTLDKYLNVALLKIQSPRIPDRRRRRVPGISERRLTFLRTAHRKRRD